MLGRYAVVSMPGAPKKGSTVPPPLSYSLKHRPISLPVNSKEINAVQKACSVRPSQPPCWTSAPQPAGMPHGVHSPC